MAPKVIVYRNQQFQPSEPFIANQAAALRRYSPLMVGWTSTAWSSLEHVDLSRSSALQRIRHKLLRDPAPLRSVIGRLEPELIHAHFGVDAVYALPLAKSMGLPLITTLHGFDVSLTRLALLRSGNPSWLNYLLHRRELAAEGALFLCVSEAVRRRALAQGFPADRTRVHYIGVDTTEFAPNTEPRGPVVLHVARLVEKKGTRFLIEAFSNVLRGLSTARLVIIGDGPLRAVLEAQVARLGLGNAVEFLGVQPRAAIRTHLQRSAVFCLPSVTAASGDAEGLPISILEALASGVPVVATRHAGIPEAVVDRECGFLVDERDVQALADRLSLLLASDTMRNEFALSARKRAEERFDLETNTAELENLYAKVGGRSGHRPSVRGARPHSANAARLPTVLQVCRHIADGGGVSGVAANVERQLVALGYTCRRLTADDMRTFVPKAFRDRRIGLAIEILAFSVRATLTLKRRSVDVNEVIIVHNDALGGDIYVNHGLHKARMKQRGVWATLRNPLHVFLLAREELRHRVPSHRAVVCLSAAERARLMTHYPVSPDLVSVIPNGVDIDFYAPLDPTLRARAREGWDLTSNDFVLLFVGKEFERKGLAIALEAMSQLPSSVMLWVVGGATATTKKWRDATKQLGLEDRVRFYGPRSDVREFYQRADAFVLPSKFEASPLVSLEAMATGLPCLLTSGAGADDYLDSEHNGLHVTSACDIARQVSRLQSDPILRADLSRAARQTALEFSWTAVARKYADLITRVSQTRGDAHDRHGNR